MPEQLNPGERLVRCLTGGSVDRLPFGVGIGWCPWGETMERWKRESGQPKLNVAQALGYDPDFAIPELESGPFPHFEPEVLEESDDLIVSRDWRGITMRNRRDGGSMPEFLDYPVKTVADWDRLQAERYRLDTVALDRRVIQNWDDFRTRLKNTGEAVQVGVFPWGVFGTARDLLGAEELLIAFYTEPDLIKDIMQHLTSLWLLLWERVAQEVQIDHIHIWEDMSGRQGSLISPAMIAEFMMPCYDRIAHFAQTHQVRMVSVDSDGDCSELVPLMMRHGVNVFFPFEVQAGNEICDYRKQYPQLGIWGGLDKRVLAQSRRDIDCELEKIPAMARLGGRFVPQFDHLIPPDVPWDNFVYAAGRIREMCNN